MKEPTSPKQNNILIRVTEADKATIQRRATEAGFRSMSGYILHCATGGTKRDGEVSILADLSRRIGLVQETAKREGWHASIADELRETAKAIRTALGFRK